MFRSMNSEEHFCERASGPRGTASMAVGSDGSARSWISMLAAVSRPAWSLLQKYLPWSSKAGKSNIDFGNQLMAGLDNLMLSDQSSTHLRVAYVHCPHENGGFLTSGGVETLSWLTGDSLRELGSQDTTKNTSPAEHGYLASTRKLLSQVLAPRAGKNNESTHNNLSSWCPNPATRSSNSSWWQGFWRSDGPQSTLPALYQSRTSTEAGTKSLHCGDYHSGAHCVPDCHGSAVRAGNPVEAFGRCDEDEWTDSERAGRSHVKESTDSTSLHKPGLEFLQNSDSLSPSREVVKYQLGTRAAATCSEVVVLTPDQDNGYSSLEEESANARQCNMNTVCESSESDSSAASQAGAHGHGGQEDKSAGNTPCKSVKNKEDEAEEEEKTQNAEAVIVHEVLPVHSTPYCQNKAIAFIMGSPCSDESDMEDSSVLDSDDDDDGFDSDDLDSYSDSEDLEDSDDEEEDDDGGSESHEFDSESERLWNSLCQTRDPYNPRNFTAPIQTSQKPCVSASSSFSPIRSPVEPSSLSSSSQSFSPSLLGEKQKEVESSEEACSSMDEADSLKLWNSFSCSSDPYSPLNFRAAIRTRQPAKQRCKQETPVEPLLYRKEAEERMDSGFSEVTTVQGFETAGVVRLKKVSFIEEVEEFYASSDEERHGPWEEYARDRCRFQRRVQEVEQSISYCLTPSFRLHVFQRLHLSS